MIHNYKAVVEWTNDNNDDLNVRTYSRNHSVLFEGKTALSMSADPVFHGDKALYNPEEMLLAALASCHMLSYLYHCALNNVIVTSYTDNATGVMETDKNGSGRFVNVTLHPSVTVKDASMIDKAMELHRHANKDCFIANSVNFNVEHVPVTQVLQTIPA